MMLKLTRTKEEHSLTQSAYDELKNTLNLKTIELNEKYERIAELRNELSGLKDELKKNRNDDNNSVNIQEKFKVIKQMVVEKDNMIKKLKKCKIGS